MPKQVDIARIIADEVLWRYGNRIIVYAFSNLIARRTSSRPLAYCSHLPSILPPPRCLTLSPLHPSFLAFILASHRKDAPTRLGREICIGVPPLWRIPHSPMMMLPCMHKKLPQSEGNTTFSDLSALHERAICRPGAFPVQGTVKC